MNEPLIKICGLTCVEDARAALEAGADFLGFVLYRGSPRYVSPDTLSALRRQLPESARCVGVFVNESAIEVERVARACGLCAVQLAGEERASEYRAFPFPVWRVVRYAAGEWTPDLNDWPAQRWVVDAAGPSYGGSGRVADWAAAAALAGERPVMLAGGLTPENVADAIRAVRPAGVDVSSGVERKPGQKDGDRVRLLIEAARGVRSGAPGEATNGDQKGKR
ncbi:MAG: phosphoribosylanthranilate isomerase [Kiritimatiellia bacterium]|nr:phosphoribosylanthranilate isomerase [Kiritimatiellia bacterium]